MRFCILLFFVRVPRFAGRMTHLDGRVPRFAGRVPRIDERVPQLLHRVTRFAGRMFEFTQT